MPLLQPLSQILMAWVSPVLSKPLWFVALTQNLKEKKLKRAFERDRHCCSQEAKHPLTLKSWTASVDLQSAQRNHKVTYTSPPFLCFTHWAAGTAFCSGPKRSRQKARGEGKFEKLGGGKREVEWQAHILNKSTPCNHC